VQHPHPRQEAELDRLLRQRERAGDDGLRGDDGGQRREQHQRHVRPARRQQVERVLDGGRVAQQQGALAEVVQHQAGQRHAEPAEPDRQPAEVPHVGVHGLAARHGQEGGAEHREADRGTGVDQEARGVPRVERGQHARRAHDAGQAEQADGREPHQHNRAEYLADGLGAAALHEEQAGQDHQGKRHDPARDARHVELEALDRAQHRDGGGDHPVAIQQRGADQAHDQQGRAPASGRCVADVEQRQHGDDAALAVVVGPHDQDSVLGRDDDDQGPEDQRQDAQDGLWRRRAAGLDGLLERVERAGADVAIDDAERRQRQPCRASLGLQHRGQRRGARVGDPRRDQGLFYDIHARSLSLSRVA
jgi:hypothetical protein